MDRGQTWNVLGSGLPITFVHDLIVHPRDFIAVIATHGRGMFTLDVSKLVEAPKPPETDEDRRSDEDSDESSEAEAEGESEG
jgi:hypothetical protein